MKIEEYLGSLPQNIMTGRDVQLPDRAFRDIFELAKMGSGDVFYHLGCGDGRGLEIARREFNAKRVVGIDSDRGKTEVAKGRGLEGAEIICDDVRNREYPGATVILFWFADAEIVEEVAAKFWNVPPGCRIITIWDPLLDYRPDQVSFPYILHETPLTRSAGVEEQVLAVFGTRCIDFTTAWKHSEMYTRAIGNAETQNDRFLTIIQSVVVWINAKNLGVACDDTGEDGGGGDVPESVRTYIAILGKFFGIEVEHLLKKNGV